MLILINVNRGKILYKYINCILFSEPELEILLPINNHLPLPVVNAGKNIYCNKFTILQISDIQLYK